MKLYILTFTEEELFSIQKIVGHASPTIEYGTAPLETAKLKMAQANPTEVEVQPSLSGLKYFPQTP